MIRPDILGAVIAGLCVPGLLPTNSHLANNPKADVEKVVVQTIRPVMDRYGASSYWRIRAIRSTPE
jgi:hypothetical protein